MGRGSGNIGIHEVSGDFLGIRNTLRIASTPVFEPNGDNELINAGFRAVLSNQHDGLRFWRSLYEKNPERADYGFLYSKGLEFYGRKEEGNCLKLELAKHALKKEGMDIFSRVSKNIVGVLRSEQLRTELVLKLATREEAEREEKTMLRAAVVFSGIPDSYVPQFVGKIELDHKRTILVMEMEDAMGRKLKIGLELNIQNIGLFRHQIRIPPRLPVEIIETGVAEHLTKSDGQLHCIKMLE